MKYDTEHSGGDYSPSEGIDQRHLEAAHRDGGKEGGEQNRQNQLPRIG